MSTDIDLMQMRLYKQLLRRRLDGATALKVCSISAKKKKRTLLAWTLCDRNTLIGLGLSADEAAQIFVALHATRSPSLASSSSSVGLLRDGDNDDDAPPSETPN